MGLRSYPNTPGGLSSEQSTQLSNAVSKTAVVVTPQMFGAIANGVNDDTVAIDAARTAAKAIEFPPGNYVYNGNGLNGNGLTLKGAGPGATTVTLGADKSLVVATGSVESLLFEGFKVVGGFGAIRCTGTGNSVQSPLVVRNNVFKNYTGAAISSLNRDQPYWDISSNMFDCSSSVANTFGISLWGDNAQTVIDSNNFIRNGCHIHLAGTGGGACKITKNDFIRFSAYASFARIDIWLSNTRADGTNDTTIAGGLGITDNKFGNENIHGSDFRLLIAEVDAASATDVVLRRPNLTSQSTLVVDGFYVTGGQVSGASSGGTPAFLTSTTGDIRSSSIGNIVMRSTFGSPFVNYLFAPGELLSSTGNVLGPLFGDYTVNGTSWPASLLVSHPGYWTINDPTRRFQDPDGALVFQGGSDLSSFLSLVSAAPSTWTQTGSPTVTAITDSIGGTDAATVAMSTTSSFIYTSVANASLVPGVPVIVEFDAKLSSTSPVTGVTAVLGQSTADKWRRVCKLSSGWRRYRFEYVPPTGTTVNRLSLKATLGTGNFDVGRIRVYRAREPINVDGLFPKLNIQGPSVLTGSVISDDATKGFVFKASDGNYWRATVSTAGAITTTNLGTTKPTS